MMAEITNEKTNEQLVEEHINNDEQFLELSELITDVAFGHRMYRGVIFFLWSETLALLTEDKKDFAYVTKVISGMKNN